MDVFLEDIEDQDGQIVLSKQKADFMKVWDKIKDIYDQAITTEGKLLRRIKGGIVVDLFGVDAFLPGSQIDIRQVKNFDQFIGEVFSLKIIKLNKSRRNIVVSRRSVLEETHENVFYVKEVLHPGQGTQCSDNRHLSTVPCPGNEGRRSSPSAFRPQGIRGHRAGCRPCDVHLSLRRLRDYG